MYANPQHSHKKIVRGRRRRLRLLMVVVLCVVCWGGMKWFQQQQEISAKVQQLQQLEGELAEVKEYNENLKLQIVRLNDDEYIEQLLRKMLHMTKEGERLFIRTE